MNYIISREHLHRYGKQSYLFQRTAILNWC